MFASKKTLVLAACASVALWPAAARADYVLAEQDEQVYSDNSPMGVPTYLPQPQQQGGINFITGGIGDEERASLQREKKNYNLFITSSSSGGAFEGDPQIAIFDKDGQQLVNAASGPLFYAKLPAGTYKIEATLGDQTTSRQVTVGSAHAANVELRWRG